MSPSASTPYPFVCVTCDLLIAGHPAFHVGLPFCCAGCVAGGPCMCSYDVDVHVVPNGSELRADWAFRPVILAEERAVERAEERESVAVA